MLQLFPLAAWLAPAMSAVLLVVLVAAADVRARWLIAFIAWFLIAAGCQFAGGSAYVTAGGLALQTLLAVVLTVTWRLSAA